MEVVLESTGLPDLLPMRDRSPGIHVSDVIYDMCVKLGYLDDYSGVDDPDGSIAADRLTIMQLGSTFEWALIQRLQRDNPSRYLIPGELERDGLYLTPDLLDLYDETVMEIKFGYRSAGRTPCSVGDSPSPDNPILGPKFYKDRTQLMSYCPAIGWTRGKLAVCHAKGDYAKDSSGNSRLRIIYNVWRFEFTEEELYTNWRSILDHADRYLCRWCGKPNCYHCPECGESVAEHADGCSGFSYLE